MPFTYERSIRFLSTQYTIAKASDTIAPKVQVDRKILPFVLVPPDKPTGPLPLIPRMNEKIDWSHTWDGSKSSLTLGDSPDLIRDYLKTRFTEEGTKLGVPPYPAASWKVT